MGILKTYGWIVGLGWFAAGGAALAADAGAGRDGRMAWWREAKFGMFIHWGLYAQFAGSYDGKEIDNNGEWIMDRASIPVARYAATAKDFNPGKFNADEWVGLAKRAGMRYLVITAKHHDGFALYPSRHSDFTLQKVTPFQRDPIKELADACPEAGLGFGLYYSNDLDWHRSMWNNNNGEDLRRPPNRFYEIAPGKSMGPDLARQDAANVDDYYRGQAIPQVRELLTNYGPLISLFFDGNPIASTVEQGLAMRTMIRQLQPQVVFNNRLRSVPGDYFSYEQRVPPAADTQIWEGCMTMNGTWGFKKSDTKWKSTAQLIFTLVDIVSKGGNFLLNIGPTGEGIIPEASVTRLKEMGAWLKVNGEAIYGAQRTAFGAEFGADDPVRKDKAGKPVFNVRRDWRCTTKPGTLYIHIFNWPPGALALKGVAGKVTKAVLLADPDRKPLPFQQEGRNVSVSFNWDAGAHQITYCTPRYAVFSNVFTPPCKSFSQTYPTGVRWVGPQTGPISMLWLTIPCYDTEKRERQVSRPHGIHGSGQSTLIHNGTLLYVCDTTGGNVNIKHALCFVPSGALAVINDSTVSQHVFLHYPGVLISLASTAPFAWDPKAQVTLPCPKVRPEDSEFRVKADRFAMAIDTEREEAIPGKTPQERLENFRKLVLGKTKLQIKPGKLSVGTHVDHNGATVERTLRGAAKVNGKTVDLNQWPMAESPWTYQAFKGETFALFNQQRKLTYDLKTFTVTEGKP